MNTKFEFQRIVDDVGRDLVAAFDKAGRQGTTPDAVGGAREAAALKRVESLLPTSVRVGSGHVIDAIGGVSRQFDVVVTEGQFCFEYSINDDGKTKYFPCQGVVAVGEVKSRLDSDTLHDIWQKVESVRRLRRYSSDARHPDGSPRPEDPREWFRPYGSSTPAPRRRGKHHDQDRKGSDQIMAFGLAGVMKARPEKIAERMQSFLEQMGKTNAPNVIGVLETGELWIPTTSNSYSDATSSLEADRFTHILPRAAVFRWIVRKIWERYCFGFTSPVDEAMSYFDTPDGWHDRTEWPKDDAH